MDWHAGFVGTPDLTTAQKIGVIALLNLAGWALVLFLAWKVVSLF